MLHVGKFFILALHGTCITQRQCHVDVQEFWKTFVSLQYVANFRKICVGNPVKLISAREDFW